MANYFVSSVDGDNTDDGTTMDNGPGAGTGAWATVEYALESGGLSAGDIVWVRRTHSETPGSDIAPAYDGEAGTPIQVIGWPRAADATADGASWTNGSTTVDLVTTLSMDTEQHIGRFLTAPNGFTYLITLITDSNTFTIDREYSGATVTLTDGAFTIKADEDWVADMGTEYGFDDSGWTIKETAWDADADDLAVIDFGGGSVQFAFATDWTHILKNLELKESVDANGIVYGSGFNKYLLIQGCYIHNTTSTAACVKSYQSTVWLKRCIVTGNNSSTHGQTLLSVTAAGQMIVEDSAIYDSDGMGVYGLHAQFIFRNVNLGVEAALDDADLQFSYGCSLVGFDVKFGGSNVVLLQYTPTLFSKVSVENYGKVLGAHITMTPQGTVTKLDVVAGSGDPYKRSGGADAVAEVLFNLTGYHTISAPIKGLGMPIFEHEFDASTDSKSYRYYVQGVGAVTASQLYITAEYVAGYDDASEYVFSSQDSDEAINARANAEDWTQYIEVTGIQPAVASKVRIRCFCSYYHAANKIYIDPLVVIS